MSVSTWPRWKGISNPGCARPGWLGGGALRTGLAAQAENAPGLIALVRRRLKDALIASADDPRLESWLAFMGNCAVLSRANPTQPFLNLDIGGGTTNLAVGLAGEVLATGCLFVGARHVQVVPGTYRITRLSSYARALFQHLGLMKQPGDELSTRDVDSIMSYYLRLLEAVVTGDEDRLGSEVDRLHVQAKLAIPPGETPYSYDAIAFTLSGGVGELVYRHLRGEPWPGTTAFGDLGIDLARRLAESPFWAEHWRRHQPDAGGRATVFGLLRHGTQVSGSTIFLPHPQDLPLRDLPILGTLSQRSPETVVAEMVRLAQGSPCGAALRIVLENLDGDSIRSFAQRLSQALQTQHFPPGLPLVLFVEQNLGKVLGQYVTDWGSLPFHIVVIDEIVCQHSQYAHIGAMHDQVLPVSFFGLR
jgi:ethanolamine utilization protein EutA